MIYYGSCPCVVLCYGAGYQQPKHVGVDCYHVYVFVRVSLWSYKMNYISLHGINNIRINPSICLYLITKQSSTMQ